MLSTTSKEYLRKRLTQVLEGVTSQGKSIHIESAVELFLSRYEGQLAQIQVINENIIEYQYEEEMEIDADIINGIRVTELYPIYLLTLYY